MNIGVGKYDICVMVYGVKISDVGIVKFGNNDFCYINFVLGNEKCDYGIRVEQKLVQV